MQHSPNIAAAAAAPVKFTVEAAALRPLLAIVAGVVERRNTIPILSNLLVTAGVDGTLSLVGSNLDIEARATIPAAVDVPGTFTVAAAALVDVIRKAEKRAQVSFAVADGRATITHGRARMTLRTLPVDDFPSITIGDTDYAFAIDGDTLAHDLARIRPAMSTEETRYYMNGIALDAIGDSLRMVATDGFYAVTIDRPTPIGAQGLPTAVIHRATIGHLAKALKALPGVNMGVRINERVGVFSMPGVEFVAKMVDGTFPDVARQHPGDSMSSLLEVDAAALSTRIAAAAARPVGGGRSRTLTIDASADGIRTGWHGADAAASPIAGEYIGDAPAAFTIAVSIGATIKALEGRLSLAWHDVDGVAVLSTPDAPEFSAIVKLNAGAPLAAPVAPEPVTYAAPAGCAADLFDSFGLGGGEGSGGGGDKPRAATKNEVALYLRDYAQRAGLPLLKGANVMYRDNVAWGCTFGEQLAASRYETLRSVDSDMNVTESQLYIPAQFTPGAYSVIMPGTRPVPVMVDLGDGWNVATVDRKGALSIDRAAVRDAVGIIEKPAKVKGKPGRPRKAAVTPAQAVEAAAAPVEPVEAAPMPSEAETAPVAPIAAATFVERLNAGEFDGADPVDPVAEAPAAAPDAADLVATVAALVARVAALEASAAAPVSVDTPAAAAPVRDRSAARLRIVRAYLAMRAQRAELRACNADLVGKLLAAEKHQRALVADRMAADDATHAALARVERDHAKRALSVRGALRTRRRNMIQAGALRTLGERCDRAESRAGDAMQRADIAERLARLGAGGTLPAPSIIMVPPAYSPRTRAADPVAA